jgi:5'(3')-deoxyribonucleotidase
MIILLDLDGVIIDLVKGVCEWFNVPHEPEKVTHWDAFPEITNTTSEEFWSSIKMPNFWEGLEFYPDAKNFISELQKHGKVVLCTSPAYGCAGYKQNWIQKNLPEFFYSGDYIITPNKENCAHQNTLLIDDSDNNCKKFRHAGGHTLLYPQPWNDDRKTKVNKNDLILSELKYDFNF